MDKPLVELCREWLDGTAKPVTCGYGPNDPNVQIERANGENTLLCLKQVAQALVDANKLTVEDIHQMSECTEVWTEDEVRAALKACSLLLMKSMRDNERLGQDFQKVLDDNLGELLARW